MMMMKTIHLTKRRFQTALSSAALLLTLAVAGCATPPAPSTVELPFNEAVIQATDALMAQTGGMGGLLAKRSVVLDPMIQAGTGQQNVATQTLQRRVAERMGTKHGAIEILPFQKDNLAKATHLLTGTLTRRPAGAASGPLKIQLALTDLRSGMVAAQSSALARDQGIDYTPLVYDQDSPVLAQDQVVEGYVRTTATPAGQRADAYYLERLAIAPVVTEAASLYSAARYQEALAQYNAAAAVPAGDQLRVLSGIYLSSVKLDRTAEAEQAFAKIVDYGIRNKQLGVKFLFNPGATAFWSDSKVSGPYGMWLHQIASRSTQAAVCLDVVGHTSRTGSEPVNDALSLQRANVIRQKLVAESAVLAGRTRASGKGFRENIIGTGSDDAVDALDRRVEFKIVGCGT